MITQVQQNRQSARAATPAPAVQACLPGGIPQQRRLPAARGADDRQYHRLRAIQELTQCMPFHVAGGQVSQ